MSAVAQPAATRAEEAERRGHINIRAPQRARDLIERAAEVSGQTLTDFVLESATRQAVDVLLDQRLFRLDDTQHAAFVQALDNPPPAGPRLKALMRRKPLWEA